MIQQLWFVQHTILNSHVQHIASDLSLYSSRLNFSWNGSINQPLTIHGSRCCEISSCFPSKRLLASCRSSSPRLFSLCVEYGHELLGFRLHHLQGFNVNTACTMSCADSSEQHLTRRKRTRDQLSCDPCRQSKLKCGREHPICDQVSSILRMHDMQDSVTTTDGK